MHSRAAAWLKANFWGANLVAGLAVGAFLIPQAMAYGQLAGVGVAVGLGLASVPLVVYPIFGKHRWLSMGPESAVALMAAATAAPIASQAGLPATTVLALLALMTGAILIAARFASAATVTDLLSKPVLTGYLTGVAVLMVCSQAASAVGDSLDSTTIVSLARSLPSADVNWYAAAVCLACAGLILALRARWRRFPGVLVVLVLAIPAGFVLPIDTVGQVSLSAPHLAVPPLHSDILLPLVTGAAAIARVAYTDTIATARAFADGDAVSAGRELTALGVSQVAVGALGGYPVSASSSRTAIARDSRATSRFYSWPVAAVAVAAPLLFAGLIAHIPKAALAAIVLVAAAGLVDLRSWRELRRLRMTEVAVALACTLGVVLLGILPGILLAVALSVAELMIRLARPHDAVLGVVPGLAGMHDIDDYPEAQTIEGLVVFRYDAPLFFANANNFFDACLDASATPGCQWLVLNVESNVEVDSTGLDALLELHGALAADGKVLALARVKNDLMIPLHRYGVTEAIGEEYLFPTLPVAVAAFLQWKGSGEPVHVHPLPVVSPVHRFARVEQERERPARHP